MLEQCKAAMETIIIVICKLFLCFFFFLNLCLTLLINTIGQVLFVCDMPTIDNIDFGCKINLHVQIHNQFTKFCFTNVDKVS